MKNNKSFYLCRFGGNFFFIRKNWFLINKLVMIIYVFNENDKIYIKKFKYIFILKWL